MQPRRLIPIALAGGLLVIAIMGIARMHAGSAAKPEAKPRTVDVIAVRNEPVTDALEAVGRTSPDLQATLSTRTSGRVNTVLVREGDRIRRGQLLATVESRDLDASVAVAQANVSAAQEAHRSAQAVAKLERTLVQTRIEQAEARVHQSESGVQAAQARLDMVRTGPRRQEREQAVLAVSQAQAQYNLAESNRARMERLLHEGAIGLQAYEAAQTQADVAKAQLQAARQSQSMAEEGGRAEELRQAEEGVRQAQSELAQARTALKSAIAASVQAEVRQQEARAAGAQVAQSRASLTAAQVSREYATISAPFDGVVTRRLMDPGDLASPGAPILQIESRPLLFTATIPASQAAALKPGMTADITIEALDTRWTARLREVTPSADPQTHTLTARYELPGLSAAVSGLYGRVRIPRGTRYALVAPASAVWEEQGLHMVWVVDNDVVRLRMVTVGQPHGERIEVTTGLKPGDVIVASGKGRLSEGDRVRSRQVAP